jgi:hypothetical protein
MQNKLVEDKSTKEIRTVAILQSNYIPWKGYFDLIHSADYFVIYDDAQYTKGDWRNRNIIMTDKGPKKLTVPVQMSGRWPLAIKEVEIADKGWNISHWDMVKQAYAKSNHFGEVKDFVRSLYETNGEKYLSAINIQFLEKIRNYLGIKTQLMNSSEFILTEEDPNLKLIQILKKLKATNYISGPAGKNYLDHDLFSSFQIEIEYIDYSKYENYEQNPHWPFLHQVSVIDMLFNLGERAPKYIWG